MTDYYSQKSLGERAHNMKKKNAGRHWHESHSKCMYYRIYPDTYSVMNRAKRHYAKKCLSNNFIAKFGADEAQMCCPTNVTSLTFWGLPKCNGIRPKFFNQKKGVFGFEET